MYATGEIPMPPLVVKPYTTDEGILIGPLRVFERRCYGDDEGELAHLDQLGLIDDEERAAARQRIKSDPHRDYDFGDLEAANGTADSVRRSSGDPTPSLGNRPSP
jgi:hypothetical protein